MITSLEWDLMSWMISGYEVEIRAQSIENEAKSKVFCWNFGGYWSMKYKRFFHIPEELVGI